MLRDEGQAAAPELSPLIASVEQSAERMTSIINDVLNARKLEEGLVELELLPTDLKDVARELFSMFGPRAHSSGVRLRVFVAHDVPRRVWVDSGRIVQMVSNFLSNALKFTGVDGSIELRFGVTDEPAWFKRKGTAKGKGSGKVAPASLARSDGGSVASNTNVKFITISVTDSGKGIASDEVARLFKPYMQANASVARQHGGTGLGLSICKQLVECMGGEIKLKSRVGKGSVFSAILPLQVVRSPPLHQQGRHEHSGHYRGRR